MRDKLILDGHKLNFHKERVEAWLKGERIAPITIDCSLTTTCTFRCIYCYGKMQRINTEPPLNKDVIFSFLDDAADIGVKAVSFVSDGESTCNPHLYEAVRRGRANGLDMALGTNGYLLKKEEIEGLLSNLTYLRFNISAGERDRYAYIHGVNEKFYDIVLENIRETVRIKKMKNLNVTIGIQMVLMPDFADQILPLAKLGKELGVDYFVIKHCSDDEEGTLGVDYEAYKFMNGLLMEAEEFSDDTYQVSAKWSKIMSEGKRKYTQCFGPPFIIQLSGSGLVAPCGMFFNDKYKKYHIGNIKEKSFKEIWESERYWEVMSEISSNRFNAQKDCGTLCLQHKVNEYLWDIKNGNININVVSNNGGIPQHVNFI